MCELRGCVTAQYHLCGAVLLRDLAEWKPEVGRSLAALLEYDKDDLETVFCLDFSVTVEV